jgi:hypothetical protein
LLSRYYDAGYKRSNGKFSLDHDNELTRWARIYDVDIASAMAKRPFYPVDSDPNPFVWVDMNKCIQCGNTMLEPGDRIAQLVIQPVLDIEFNEVEELDEDTDRGTAGLGSTGTKVIGKE